MVVLYVAGQRVGTLAEAESLIPELAAQNREVELRDEAGKLIARVVPPEPLCPWEPNLTREELDRRRAQGGTTLAEFWKRMGVVEVGSVGLFGRH